MAGGAAKVWWKCSKGHEWKAQLATRSKGCGCPVCCESKGEKRIAAFLDSKQYNYERQVKFDGCRYRNKLPFDFGVQILGKLHLIEYQGEQHYQPVAFGSKQDDPVARFRLTKRRDKIKEKYCSDNDIPLLTIPYWKRDDTEMMVSEFLGGTC